MLRTADLADAETIAALAIQVFLDTYATAGVRPDLAREAFAEYGHEAFSKRVRESDRIFHLAEDGDGLLGFAEVVSAFKPSPVEGFAGSELVRLYVQPRAQGSGVGRALIEQAERNAASSRSGALWLSAWELNTRALGFYARLGYRDVGPTSYVIQGQSFANRIFYKRIDVDSAQCTISPLLRYRVISAGGTQRKE